MGTRIRVYDIHIWHDLRGQTADEIVADFPQLTLADVYAALTYYHDHREEIQAQVRSAEEAVRTMKAAHGPGLLDRALQADDAANAIPPR